MARTPASDGSAGVGKSGSPAPRSITSSPAALRRFASCEIAIVAEVSRWCRLGERPDPGVMGDRIAPRSTVGNRLPLDGWHGTILPSDRPLTTEDRVTVADAKAALERGRPVVLVRPPAVEQARDLWELLGPLAPAHGPGVGPRVLVLCADDASAAEWVAAAPVDRPVHAVTGLARTGRVLKERPVEILAGAAKDIAALLERAALKLAAVAGVVLAWPEALVDGDGAAAVDTVLGEARNARPAGRGAERARRLHRRGPTVLSSLGRDPYAPGARLRCRSRARSRRSAARARGGAAHDRQRGRGACPARSAVRAVRSGGGRGRVAGTATGGGQRDAGCGSHGPRRGRPRESVRRPGEERPRERQGSRRSLDSR